MPIPTPIYQRILIPLDGSETAYFAVSHAVGLAAQHHSELILLYLDYLPLGTPNAEGNPNREQVHARVLRLRDLLNEEGYRARELWVETRNLSETLLKVIEDEQVHLIVMSMQGRTEMLRWIFGANVEKALNTLPVPVLLARPVYSTIVIPMDGSSWSESAIPKAVEMARNNNAELVLLHVFQSPTSSYDSQLALAGQQDMVDQAYTEMHDHLIAIRNMLRKEGLRVREHIIRGSNPAQAICDYTDTVEGMCMIVMSTHGRTGLSRWLVGSVAQRVIKNANCPVTLVHQGSGD